MNAQLTRDEQRHEIARLLITGQWRGAKTREELCARWGCKAGDIYRLTGEAAGAIRLSRTEGWGQEIDVALGDLEAVHRAAWQVGDLAMVVQVVKVKLGVYGALGGAVAGRAVGPPQSHVQAQTALANMRRQDRIALLRSALADEMSGTGGGANH